VLGGYKAPYHRAALPTALTEIPAHEYGRQKLEAERWIERTASHWMILRLTYALGVRPFPNMGRPNPLEIMFEDLTAGHKQIQVADRYFSACFAEDAARAIWAAVQYPVIKTVWHVGTPVRTSRYGLALLAAAQVAGVELDKIAPVNHTEAFPDLPDRPLDTTYGDSARYWTELPQGIQRAYRQWQQRTDWYSHEDRGDELALFFGTSAAETRARLAEGFGFNHGKVAEDWRRSNPKTDEDILRWYKETDAYCYELSAYHNDRGFNYLGMCTGIAQHLKREGATRVLCLGDGIGDLTLVLREHGLDPIYHDLGGSITSMFAAFRFWRRSATPLMLLTPDWKPPEEVYTTFSGDETDPEGLLRPDAIIALDFFEHLPNVVQWAQACAALLKPGGWFLAQNAFGIGDEEHEGSIPMHLTRNNQYVTTWPILLDRVGFALDPAGSGWWKKVV
jgi:SAM-dependent methyltransferase